MMFLFSFWSYAFFIILYFYNGCNITVKFFTLFYHVVYLLSTDKPSCAYSSYVLCVLYKCFQMWYNVLLTTDKFNYT
jgi:hypothetical protein